MRTHRYGLAHVLLAGGTFANVRLNQKILEVPGIESVYVHPNMGDGGIAVGGALLLAAEQGEARPYELRDVYWGDDWSDTAIRAELEGSRGIQWRRLDDPADAIGDAMAQKQVVGVFQGRMEYGPRALGHRSILAEPTDTTMMDWLNKRLSRTEFMPFAPIVIEEEAPRFFEDFARSAYPARFMTICLDCTPYCVEQAPASCTRTAPRDRSRCARTPTPTCTGRCAHTSGAPGSRLPSTRASTSTSRRSWAARRTRSTS